MSTRIQVAVDCAEPHRLASFWAAALGYEVEDHSSIVAQMLEQGHATEDDTTTVDGRLAWRGAAACWDPSGGGPRLLFQEVPEPKSVKNRVHLDLHVGADRRDAEVERLVGLGATRVGVRSQGPQS